MTAPAAIDPATSRQPVTPEEFGRLAAAAGLSADRASPLAVAVSGGGDSMALAHLVAAWSGGRRGTVAALIVDHRLRRDSAAEAAAVAGWVRRIGLVPHVLVWHHGDLTGRIQETARAARYRRLVSWCQRNGVTRLLLAHHLDDQAETLLLRLASGSGIRGLGCMRTRLPLDTIELVRPLLAIPKSRLLATIRHRGGGFVDDPSNRDLRYTRNRIRGLLQDPASRLPEPATLTRAARSFRRLAAAADRAVARHLGASLQVSPLGWVAVGRSRLATLPDLLALPCLGAVVQAVGGRPYPPRTRSLRLLLEAVRSPRPRTCTLGGAILAAGHHRVTVTREPRSVAGPTRLHRSAVRWDHRFRVETRIRAGDITVGALGLHPPGGIPASPDGLGVRRTHFATLPAFRDLDGLVAVPHLDWWRDKNLRTSLRAVFEPRSELLAGVMPASGNGTGYHRNIGQRGHA